MADTDAAMTDARPILRQLLGSLTTIDQRLSSIETALQVAPPAPLPSRAAPLLLCRGGGEEEGKRKRERDMDRDMDPDRNMDMDPDRGVPMEMEVEGDMALVPGVGWKRSHAMLVAGGSDGARGAGARADHGDGRDDRDDWNDRSEWQERETVLMDDNAMVVDESAGAGAVLAAAASFPPMSAVPWPAAATTTATTTPSAAAHGPLEALPEGFLVTGRATLQEELDGWTIPRGYSMRINGTRSHGRRQKIRMVCFRGGRSRLRPKEEEGGGGEEPEHGVPGQAGQAGQAGQQTASTDAGLGRRRQRKPTTDRVSKKCECPFRFELVEVGPGADRYAVHYTNDDHRRHNHVAADLMLDPRARKLPAALKDEVDQWLRGSGHQGGGGGGPGTDPDGAPDHLLDGTPWTIAKIQAELQRRGYGHVLDFDLRNRKRALLHKERMAQLKTEGGGGGGGGGSGGGSENNSNAGSSPANAAT